MKKIIQTKITPTKFLREPEISIDGFRIVQGDLLKIKGEYGSKFKFNGFITNLETGDQWVDCFEIVRGQVAALRSFKPDRIKRIPKKGMRAKRVND
jgi:hypothetical protein